MTLNSTNTPPRTPNIAEAQAPQSPPAPPIRNRETIGQPNGTNAAPSVPQLAGQSTTQPTMTGPSTPPSGFSAIPVAMRIRMAQLKTQNTQPAANPPAAQTPTGTRKIIDLNLDAIPESTKQQLYLPRLND